MGYRALAQQIADAIADHPTEQPILQVTLFFNRAAPVVDYALCTTHKPGGYIARGGEHIDAQYDLRDPFNPSPNWIARSLIQRARYYAYSNLAADDPDQE